MNCVVITKQLSYLMLYVGHLLTHMLPSINPDEEIDDINDIKPLNWVDKEMIPDSTASKPIEWDESQPKKIPDISAKKPDLWDEYAEEMIPDPTAIKPIDWDDEEVGDIPLYIVIIVIKV